MIENWRIDSLSKTAFKAVVEGDQNLMELEYVPAGSQSDATINWAIRPRGVPRGGRVFCSIVWRTFLCPLHVCLFILWFSCFTMDTEHICSFCFLACFFSIYCSFSPSFSLAIHLHSLVSNHEESTADIRLL